MENSEEKLDDKNDSKEEENNKLISKNKEVEKEEEVIELQEPKIMESSDIPQNIDNSKSIININKPYNKLYNRISEKCSFCYEKIKISSDHLILFLSFFISGLIILEKALMSLPSSLLISQNLLKKISLGNICIILSSLFFYGSDTFLEVFKDCGNAVSFCIYIIFDIAGLYLQDINNYTKLDLVILPVDIVFIFVSLSALAFFFPGKEKIINLIDFINSIYTKIKNKICCCCSCCKKNKQTS